MRSLFKGALALFVVIAVLPAGLSAAPMSDLSSAEGVHGVWKSDGYGYVLQISQDTGAYKLFHATDTVCVAVSPDEDDPLSYLESFALADEGERLVFKLRNEAYRISFQRAVDLPSRCRSEQRQDTFTAWDNYDAFVSYFETHYGFFDVHSPNWLDAADRFRSQIDENSRDADIIEPMIGLLSQLKDGHVSIQATIDGDEGEFVAYPGPTLSAVQSSFSGQGNPMSAFGRRYLRDDIENAILRGEGQNAANERIKYGLMDEQTGYIAIMAIGRFNSDPDASFEQESVALERALDDVLEFMHRAKVDAVLLDLSVNRGGYDFLARQIASRFAKEPYFAYSKFAADATDQTPQGVLINPSSRRSFHGPVYIMTSDITVSAAEVLTLSMRALPNVTHIGSKTRGALSDVLTKRLPNGWTVTLSNEVYRDHLGQSWEGRGIPPEFEWDVFDPSDPFTGHMPAIARAAALIQSHRDQQ